MIRLSLNLNDGEPFSVCQFAVFFIIIVAYNDQTFPL